MARGEEVVERMAEKHGAQGRCRVFRETCAIMRCRCTIMFIHLGGQWYLIYGSSKRPRCLHRVGTASEGSTNPAAMQKVCRQFERELLQASWFRWKGTAAKRPEFSTLALLRS